MPHAYILKCSDGSYYVGSTNSLEHRLFQHHNGLGPLYTRERRPLELAWAGAFETVAHAYAFEQQIKKWSRAKKEALIEGRYTDLPDLSSRSTSARRRRSGEPSAGGERALRDGRSPPSSGTQDQPSSGTRISGPARAPSGCPRRP
ncbi:MAG: GIY-YIG nuclease family protein [Marmoricola sp.]